MTTDSVTIINPLPGIKRLANANLPERPVDEFANFLTHGLGFILSVPASVVLLSLARERTSLDVLISCTVYAVSLVGLYAASTLSHTFYTPSRRRFYQTLDQAFIYFLIAGTFTPFGVIYLGAGWEWLLPAVWVLAVIGALMVYWTRDISGLRKVIPYVIFGWFPVMGIGNVIAQAPPSVIFWLVLGGAMYTVGTVFLIMDHKVRYFHALWHALVMGASISHYIAILQSTLAA